MNDLKVHLIAILQLLTVLHNLTQQMEFVNFQVLEDFASMLAKKFSFRVQSCHHGENLLKKIM